MRVLARMLSAAALAWSMTGCAASDVIYDPYWHDYHRWNLGENRYYRHWETGSNRNHVDFPNRTPGDQLAYWQWRHGN
jgi:hypothetical protein